MQEIGPAFSLFHYESLLSKVYRRDRTHRHKSNQSFDKISFAFSNKLYAMQNFAMNPKSSIIPKLPMDMVT